MKIEESGIEFDFPDEDVTLKFDDNPYYTKYFKKMDGAKGVDFISVGKKKLLFIEVKNCLGHESDNNWRVFPNNKKVKTSATVNTEGRESLDVEVSKKVAMTISNIVGAGSFGGKRDTAKNLIPLLNEITSEKYATDDKKWYVILFLEGNFGCESRKKKMIMRELQDSMKIKLSWLNCKVSVVDSDTYKKELFKGQIL